MSIHIIKEIKTLLMNMNRWSSSRSPTDDDGCAFNSYKCEWCSM